MIDIKIGCFQVDGTPSLVNRVSEDNKRLEGMVGERVQRLFNKMSWNTTYVIENLAGVYFAENDSYNGNIGLLERNLIDMYFTPNSYNVFTRKIGLSRAVVANELLLMQIVDPPKIQGAADIMNISIAFNYWIIQLIFVFITLFFTLLFYRSYLFILKFLNKRISWRSMIELLMAAIFYCLSILMEQYKSHNQSESFLKFVISFLYIGFWLWNRLCGSLMQTEAFRIDVSKIINSLEQTFYSENQACLLVNEPLSYEFMEGKLKIFNKMFPTKSRHLYQVKLADILDFMRNYKTRIFIATSIFVRSVSWSLCTYLRDEMGHRKVFLPTFLIDESIAVYYYNLKADPPILYAIDRKFSVAVIEQSLISYQRNPSKLNLLDTDVQNFCVVRNLKVLEEASIHSGSNLDQQLELDSYFHFFSIYFILIICILMIALIIHFFNILTAEKCSNKKRFLHKLGCPLAEEILLKEFYLNRNILNGLFINVNTIIEIVESKEFYIHLNPFQNELIRNAYQMMKLKYRRIRKEIECKILLQDNQFNKHSSRKSIFASTNHHFSKSSQDVQADCKLAKKVKFQLDSQVDKMPQCSRSIDCRNDLHLKDALGSQCAVYDERSKKTNFQNGHFDAKHSESFFSRNSAYESQARNFVNEVTSSSLVNHFNYWQKLRANLIENEKSVKFTQNDNYTFEYFLPSNIDLILKKYDKNRKKITKKMQKA